MDTADSVGEGLSMNDPILKSEPKANHHPLSKHQLPLNTAPSGLLGELQTFAPQSPRRTTHGGCAWSLPSRDRDSALRQPQDGSLTNAGQSVASGMLSALRARTETLTTTHDHDDKLSGATRSLSSRVLGLNGMKPKPGLPIDTDTERYFEEHSPMFQTESLRQGAVRKGPNAKRSFSRVTPPQTSVA